MDIKSVRTRSMQRLSGLLLLLPLTSAMSYGAPGSTTLAAVSADIQQVCTQPVTAGEHWTVTGTLTGNVGVQIKSLAAVTGALGFTKEEWSGIQQVLSRDQAGDNESYRRCVETLTPLFLAKVPMALKDRSDVDRRFRAFLAAKQLAVPGESYTDATLWSQYGVRTLPNEVNLSYPILTGSYRVLTADINGPVGHFSRLFVERNGALVGVLIVQTCAGGAAAMCANNYADWQSSIEPIVGNLQESKQELAGGPGAGPFANQGGTLTKSIAYDDPWRVYIDRLDASSGGPTAITLVVARDGN